MGLVELSDDGVGSLGVGAVVADDGDELGVAGEVFGGGYGVLVEEWRVGFLGEAPHEEWVLDIADDGAFVDSCAVGVGKKAREFVVGVGVFLAEVDSFGAFLR